MFLHAYKELSYVGFSVLSMSKKVHKHYALTVVHYMLAAIKLPVSLEFLNNFGPCLLNSIEGRP